MKRFIGTFAIMAAMMMAVSCGKDSGTSGGGEGSGGGSSTLRTDFYFGADVSWVTEMEKDHKKFYDNTGKELDLFYMFKTMGQSISRLRVWVDPVGGWCGYDDVYAKAKRAQDAGLSVMLDFHYSDFFADPGKQNMPAAWVGKSHAELVQAVSDYTKEFLTKIKLGGINPAYIQIGNETRNGMLWPDGQLWNDNGDIDGGWERYVELSNAGFDAAKSVFPSTKVMVHLNHAFEDNTWWFSKFLSKGGKYDMIGLSHYPQTDSEKDSYIVVNSLAISNVEALAKATGKTIMIVETGVKASYSDSPDCIKSFLSGIYKIEAVKGVLYWEPEVYGGWKPAIYDTFTPAWNAYDMGAFDNNGKPMEAIKVFVNK